MKFVDEVTITVRSGKGGPGCVSFRSESKAARGGPDGGDGGRGGDVVFRVTHQLNSLLEYRFKTKYFAPDGRPGAGSNMSGPSGETMVLPVPLGTVIKDADSGDLIVDLSDPGDYVFLKGGRGGKGNYFFRTSVNQAPEHAQPGEMGETRTLHLELKLIADVGVIGYPNAGKSTLISVMSAARPKIADYPFTTLTPNLGVAKVDESRTFVVADIPGLVPGAHKGIGLGTQFLRHIERTNVFIHLVDASESDGRQALQDYRDILHELAEYDKLKVGEADYQPLRSRPQLVVLNKIDVLSRERQHEIVEIFRRENVATMSISAAARQGIRELIFAVAEALAAVKKSAQ